MVWIGFCLRVISCKLPQEWDRVGVCQRSTGSSLGDARNSPERRDAACGRGGRNLVAFLGLTPPEHPCKKPECVLQMHLPIGPFVAAFEFLVRMRYLRLHQSPV